MKIDLKAMTHGQLTRLIARAKQHKTELEKETVVRIQKKVRAMIESEGLTLKEVLGELRKGRSTVNVGSIQKSDAH